MLAGYQCSRSCPIESKRCQSLVRGYSKERLSSAYPSCGKRRDS